MSSPEEMVYQALLAACSQDLQILKQAELKLGEWELQPGFYFTLVTIFGNHQIDSNVRWMAAVYVKTGIGKYWRKSNYGTKHEISSEEKVKIRQFLISNFDEPVGQIADQVSSIIGKIVRIDGLKEWPNLIPTLMKVVKSNDQLQQHRALLVLQQVIKALAAKRLMMDRKNFEQLTTEIYSYILNLWDSFTSLFFQSLQQGSSLQITISFLEKTLWTLKILKKLTIYGLHKPSTFEHCELFFEAIFRRIKEFIECRFELKRSSTACELINLMEKIILKQTKILNDFLEYHPVSFINLIATSLEFSFNYVFHNGANMIFDGNVINFPNFAIQCINLMKGILSSQAYTRYTFEHSENIKAKMNLVFDVKKEFFTRERLCYICEKLITHYFLLTNEDLELWLEDPEGFAADDGGESWKYVLRPCTETFFLTLVCNYQKELAEEVLKYITKAQENTLSNESSLSDILLKDAIYNAAGQSTYIFLDNFDFKNWMQNQLIIELKINSTYSKIIKKRILWLIAQWFNVNSSRDALQVYSICLHLLQPTEDMAVRLQASKTLMATIDDFEFSPKPFLPFLEPCFGALFTLLKEGKECDTKMNVLSTMSFIVERMADNIQPHAHNLISYLPFLWEESEEHNMLRCAILSTLVQIIKALYDIPQNLLTFLYRVISISTDVKQACFIYLIEEALELWLAVVDNTSQISQELLYLCDNIIPIIESSSENLQTVLNLMQSYILLAPDLYLQRYGKQIVSVCAYLINDMRAEGIIMVMKLFETMLRIQPSFCLELLKPVLPHICKQVYDNKEFSTLMGMYLSILARVLITDQQLFIQVIQSLNLENSFGTIIDVWVEQMPLLYQSEKKKLLSLALGSLLATDDPIINERFSGIVQNISDALSEIMKKEIILDDEGVSVENVPKQYVDSLVFADDNDCSSIIFQEEDSDNNTHHSLRYKQLCLKDPVFRITLKDFIQTQFSTLKQNIPEQRYQNLIATVDPYVLKQLTKFVDILVPLPVISQ